MQFSSLFELLSSCFFVCSRLRITFPSPAARAACPKRPLHIKGLKLTVFYESVSDGTVTVVSRIEHGTTEDDLKEVYPEAKSVKFRYTGTGDFTGYVYCVFTVW